MVRRILTLLALLGLAIVMWTPRAAAANPAIRLQGSFGKTSYVPRETFSFAAVLRLPQPSADVDVSLLILTKSPGRKTLFTKTVTYGTLPRGITRVVFRGRLRSIGALDGVYPAIVEVTSGGETIRVSSRLVVVDPKRHGPMLVALVWNVNQAAQITPGGVYLNGAVPALVRRGRSPGYLAMQMGKLAKHSNISASINVTPQILDELLGVVEGYKRRDGARIVAVGPDSPEAADARAFFAQLVSLMRSGRVEAVPAPYAYPALPELTRRGWDEDVHAQMDEGQNVLERALATASTPGVFSPQLRLSSGAAEVMRKVGVEYALVESRPGIDRYESAQAMEEAARGLRLAFNDDAAGRIIAAPRQPGEVVRDLVAHLAAVRLGRGRRPSAATIVLSVRSGWRPSASLVDALYTTLGSTPWIRTVTVGRAVDETRSHGKRVTIPAYQPNPKLNSYYERIEPARESLLVYSSMAGRGNPLAAGLRRNLLIAQSATWNEGGAAGRRTGLTFADDVTRTVAAQLAKISMPASQTITFPGQSGKVAVAVTNGTRFPLTAAVWLTGDSVGFPKGRFVRLQLEPGENYLTFAVAMKTRGVAPVRVRVTSAGRLIAYSVIYIRSTYFNRMVFLAIVILALMGLLVVVYRKAKTAGGR